MNAVNAVGHPKIIEILFKCFLATESLTGTNAEDRGTTNKGSLTAPGNESYMTLKSLSGHRGEAPRLQFISYSGLSCSIW